MATPRGVDDERLHGGRAHRGRRARRSCSPLGAAVSAGRCVARARADTAADAAALAAADMLALGRGDSRRRRGCRRHRRRQRRPAGRAASCSGSCRHGRRRGRRARASAASLGGPAAARRADSADPTPRVGAASSAAALVVLEDRVVAEVGEQRVDARPRGTRFVPAPPPVGIDDVLDVGGIDRQREAPEPVQVDELDVRRSARAGPGWRAGSGSRPVRRSALLDVLRARR